MALPPRATLFAADGTPLAEGPDRTSPISDVASQIVGMLGPIPRGRRGDVRGRGLSGRTRKVGLDGLERAFQTQLAGTPGGRCSPASGCWRATAPVRGHDVTTTIEPSLERAAIAALGGRYGGIAAMDPRTGAAAGARRDRFSAPQPPGSTMKIITSTGGARRPGS